MGHFISITEPRQKEMLEAIGLSGPEDLYAAVPKALLLNRELALPEGKSELEVLRHMEGSASKNTVFPTVFRGAGAYRHYIPAVVSAIASKETFVTAYTPYQAEISQGILQAIFEYQTMICQLTGLEVANASVYDGPTAAAEAAVMCRERKRTKTLMSACAHPDVIHVVQTYCWGAGADLTLIPEKDGLTDMDALKELLDESVSCVYIAQPNFFGLIEDAEGIAKITHEAGAKLVMGINPISAAVLKTPSDCGADIAVGEGQPLGMPLSFGGPYLGFMATSTAMMRRLPGRIAGETVDSQGRRAFVLTLQAREQHIRREKASSNICSNQALCALTAAAYLSAMGPGGLQRAALSSLSKAHYLAEQLATIPGYERRHKAEFFHEFVTNCPNQEKALNALEAQGILGGLPVENGGLLWCATELNTKEEMDRVVAILREVQA